MTFARLAGLIAFTLAFDVSAHTRILNRRVERDETVAHALYAAELPRVQVDGIIGALSGVFDFRKAREGDQLRLVFNEGELDFFDYRQGPLDEWQVRRDGDRLVGSRREMEVEKQTVLVEISVDSSLFAAVQAAGEQDGFATNLADVFAWDIDFYRDVRKGDKALAVVEKFLSKGRLVRYGEILAAEYQGEAVGERRIFRYQPPNGLASYFQQDGKSARKAFLKSPLKFNARVTSGFGNRFHPILQYVKAHNGVDYGTPVGSEVWAVADGQVVKAARDDVSGSHVCIRHVNNFETCYLHLSRFASGIHLGARVGQKQIIGYSGSTGRSTGPHLHFALKRNGQFVNPLNQNFPRADPLPKTLLTDFLEKIAPFAQKLNATSVAAVVPPGH